jgi:hypothetical protein
MFFHSSSPVISTHLKEKQKTPSKASWQMLEKFHTPLTRDQRSFMRVGCLSK